MKQTLKLILGLSLILTVNSCKKDYPKDIPDWLEDYIKEEKKKCRGSAKQCNCGEGDWLCKRIYEYKTPQDETIYYHTIVYSGPGPISVSFWDALGNEFCSVPTNFGELNCQDTCNTYALCDLIYQRDIWIQHTKY